MINYSEEHVANNRLTSHARHLGIGKPFARFVWECQTYNLNQEPANWNHWVITYNCNMVAHCSGRWQLHTTASAMIAAYSTYWNPDGTPRYPDRYKSFNPDRTLDRS